MAVYRRSYKAYTGRLTAAWSRCFVLFRYSRRNLFRSKFVTALFVLCFFWPLFCLLWIYLAHSASFLREMGVPGDALLSFHQRAGRVCISSDRVHRPRLDFAGSRQWGAAVVLLPAVFTNRVCSGEVGGAGNSAFANHMGARIDSLRSAGQPGGRELDMGEFLDCG